ncbi:hypothetical protein [Streptomyces sp. NPDC026659]|uniref:hypothetical protein n=1 Tax=Streptomyces sp. NPDC026659 TaxID=3155123 RepID=UPI0034036920
MSHLLQTVARGTDGRNKAVITATAALGCVISCVMNGDTMTNILYQGTWLVVAITVLIIVRAVAAVVLGRMTGALSRQVGDSDTNG